MPPLQTILAVGGAVALGAGLLFFGSSAPQPAPIVIQTEAAPRAAMTVHVSGAVARPGLVIVAENARVADAVAAAGGALPEAALGVLNLAAPVRDGQLIVVPGHGADGADPQAEAVARGIRVNSATVAELEQLPGVGPVLAARIVAHRDANGPFTAVEDLLDVPGIGEAKLASLRDQVVIP